MAKALLRSASISEHDHLIDFVLRLLLSQGLAEDLISSLVQDQLTHAPEQLCSETVVSKLITAYAFKVCYIRFRRERGRRRREDTKEAPTKILFLVCVEVRRVSQVDLFSACARSACIGRQF